MSVRHIKSRCADSQKDRTQASYTTAPVKETPCGRGKRHRSLLNDLKISHISQFLVAKVSPCTQTNPRSDDWCCLYKSLISPRQGLCTILEKSLMKTAHLLTGICLCMVWGSASTGDYKLKIFQEIQSAARLLEIIKMNSRCI